MLAITNFLSAHRIALVGISRNPAEFSHHLHRALTTYGYEVIPVHPTMAETEGVLCYAQLAAIDPPPDAVLVMTAQSTYPEIARECAGAGVQQVWFYHRVSSETLEICRSAGIEVVQDECPLMFLPDAGFPHSLHRFIRKLTFSYPA